MWYMPNLGVFQEVTGLKSKSEIDQKVIKNLCRFVAFYIQEQLSKQLLSELQAKIETRLNQSWYTRKKGNIFCSVLDKLILYIVVCLRLLYFFFFFFLTVFLRQIKLITSTTPPSPTSWPAQRPTTLSTLQEGGAHCCGDQRQMVIWAFSPHGHLCEGMPGHPMDGQQGKGHHLLPKGQLFKEQGFSHAFQIFP